MDNDPKNYLWEEKAQESGEKLITWIETHKQNEAAGSDEEFEELLLAFWKDCCHVSKLRYKVRYSQEAYARYRAARKHAMRQ